MDAIIFICLACAIIFIFILLRARNAALEMYGKYIEDADTGVTVPLQGARRLTDRAVSVGPATFIFLERHGGRFYVLGRGGCLRQNSPLHKALFKERNKLNKFHESKADY